MKKNYIDKVHTWGILWDIGAIFVLLCVPVIICFNLGVLPDFGALKTVMPKLMGLYWLTAIVEVITYVPLLGAGGTYLSFVTGNISNLKLPCGLKAMENAKVRANTEEGEVVATIAIAVSAIVTTVILAIGVAVFGSLNLLQYLTSGPIAPAFDYVAASYFAKHLKLCFAPLIVGVAVLFIDPTMGAGTLMFITIVAAVAGAFVLYKAKKL